MRFSRILAAALALPLLAGCEKNETLGPVAVPSGGSMFANYIAVGTSISAGFQSGGLTDSTQRQGFPYLLAQAMGLAPNTDWFYPAFSPPGCPPPYTNILTGARLGGASAPPCSLLFPGLTRPYFNTLGVPSIRVGQVLNIQSIPYGPTDTLQLAQFITGTRNPIDIVLAAHPTFVTLEIGANDVLGAATNGDTTLLTPVQTLEGQFTVVADSIDATHAKVAVANVPNVDNIPHFSAGVIFYCLHNGFAACGNPSGSAQPPFNSPGFTVDANCLPAAAGGVGDKMLVGFRATGPIAATLADSGAASLNCGAGTATITLKHTTTAIPLGHVMAPASVLAIATEVVQIDSFIHLQANARGWAYVDLNGGLTAARTAGQVPAFPNLASASTIFGPIFSYDGIHPNAAGHKIIADAFVAAINAKFGTTLTPP